MKYKSIEKRANRLFICVILLLFLSNALIITSSDISIKADEDSTENVPPSYGIPSPASGSTDTPLTFSWTILIKDDDGDLFNWSIWCSGGQSKIKSYEANGTKKIDFSGLSFDTLYYVWVNASDLNDSTSAQYTFTTRSPFTPEPPVNLNAITTTDSQIDISWTIGDGADGTLIEWNIIPGWIPGEGTEVYNGSGTEYSHNDLFAHRRYFYQAWSWNETDRILNKNYTSSNAYRFGFIPENGDTSPIRKYFTTKKILWTFDDYSFTSNHHPPHLGFTTIPEVVIGYGGHVNIMVILFRGNEVNEIRNYSVFDELEWDQDVINKSLEFFDRENIYPASHGWDYRSGPLNNATLEEAYLIINYTMWNWKNNFDIEPHFFLGGSTSGNYNITVALKKFSDKYWPVYGENFRWQNPTLFPETSRNIPAVEFITKQDYVALFDPLFGCYWGEPCESIDDAKELFNLETEGMEIIFIRGHPKDLDGTERSVVENISLWKKWIDWIYQNHDLININHTQAIQYNVDRYNFKIFKNTINNFTIDLSECIYDHNILFTQPYEKITANWKLYDENKAYIGEVVDDSYHELQGGGVYYFVSEDEFTIDDINLGEETPAYGIIGVLFSLFIVYIVIIKRKS